MQEPCEEPTLEQWRKLSLYAVACLSILLANLIIKALTEVGVF